MSLHLVIIDALNLIRRVHSVQPDATDIARTIDTTGKTLQRIINEAKPTHMVAVFDHYGLSNDHEPSNDQSADVPPRGWRAELLPDYKAKRKPMPEPLFNGLDDIQDAWWQLGLDSLLSEGDEADDLVATLACKVASADQKTTIISTDKGYCQLLQPKIQIRDYFQNRWLDTEFIAQEFGVTSTQLADYWGLAGISSSQVSGVPGIGPKAAQEILTQYTDIEAAFAADDLALKYRKKLDQHIDLARRCKQVATLKTDIELGFNLRDLRFGG